MIGIRSKKALSIAEERSRAEYGLPLLCKALKDIAADRAWWYSPDGANFPQYLVRQTDGAWRPFNGDRVPLGGDAWTFADDPSKLRGVFTHGDSRMLNLNSDPGAASGYPLRLARAAAATTDPAAAVRGVLDAIGWEAPTKARTPGTSRVHLR